MTDPSLLWVVNDELHDTAILVGDVDLFDDWRVQVADLVQVAMSDDFDTSKWLKGRDRDLLGFRVKGLDHGCLIEAVVGCDIGAGDAFSASHGPSMSTPVQSNELQPTRVLQPGHFRQTDRPHRRSTAGNPCNHYWTKRPLVARTTKGYGRRKYDPNALVTDPVTAIA